MANPLHRWSIRAGAAVATSADGRRRLKWPLISVWLLAGLLLFWGLAYALVPVVAKWQIEKLASSQLGRAVTVGGVDFKPWSLELVVNDLAIAQNTKDTKNASNPSTPQLTPQLTVKRIYINAELESLLRLTPVVDAVQVDAPQVLLTHLGGGRYDIDDVLDKLKSPADAKPSEPARFALYNLKLVGGSVSLTDVSASKTHQITALDLSIPFLSNLAAKRDVKTEPRLAFKLGTAGGPPPSSFDSAGQATPFAVTRKTDAVVKLNNFDLAPYVSYLPAGLPFKLVGAVLNADAKVAFEQNPNPAVKFSGLLAASKVSVNDKSGKALMGFDQLNITLDDVQPLTQLAQLARIELVNPAVNISRDRTGRLNVFPADDALTPNSIAASQGNALAKGINKPKNEVKASPDVANKSAGQVSTQSAAVPSSWKVAVAAITVRGGAVSWQDDSLASPASIKLGSIELDAAKLALPFTPAAPLALSGSAAWVPAGRAAVDPQSILRPATIQFSGTATDKVASVSTTVAAWPLGMAASYLGQFLRPTVNAQLDAQLGLQWQAAKPGLPQAITVTAAQASLSGLVLAQGKLPLASAKRIQLDAATIDVTGQKFKASKLQVVQPKGLLERDAEGRWMFEGWAVDADRLVNKQASPGSTKAINIIASSLTNTKAIATSTVAATPTTSPWRLSLDDITLSGGALQFVDKAPAKPVAFDVGAVNLRLQGLVLNDKTPPKPGATQPPNPKLMPLETSLRLGAGGLEPGQLSFKGGVGMVPVQLNGQVQAERLPVQAFEPYFADALNIELLRADASFKGKVAFQQTPVGPRVEVSGDAAVEDFKANTLAPSEDLLAWKALALRGLTVALEPAKPAQVGVQETVMSDFFARLIVLPDGRINLQDLLKPTSVTTSATSTTSSNAIATNSGATSQGNTLAKPLNDAKNDAKTAASSPAVAAVYPSSAANAPIINVGPVSLVNGRVAFSDRFIKPNYSADLTELTGRLSAFSSVAKESSPSMADLELRGRAEGTASLEIVGKLNPLAKPLALDITGKVRDLELPPLSPYAIKYAGYGITRGKMSVDVSYLVLPDGKLTAKNKLVLNQLSFGDKVEGSTASLPVKLAVALLSDRNGVIDLDLPISGSLNDPQFSIGPIIIKVIGNVIVKAITAPFSLLASALGGGSGGGADELGTVAFASGSAVLADDAKAGLDKVAKALLDRPSLKLTVIGASNLEAERDGYKRARLGELVRAEKRRSIATGALAGTATAAITVSPAEYPALLKEAYKRADITKPRNLVGLAKDLPVDEMEKLLLADIKVSDDTMQALALQRGVAVKEYLASKALPLDRLFLGAGDSGKADAKADAKTETKADSKWVPRADLNIAM